MKISGFSMGKNARKLYYPMRHAIESILPLVDEFVVALGDSDEDDSTRAEIEAIGSEKVRIIDTVWDIEKFPRGMEHAHQTDIAKQYCTGDWLFYLQSDEVVHEKDLDKIRERCRELVLTRRWRDCFSGTAISGGIMTTFRIHIAGTVKRSGLSGTCLRSIPGSRPSHSGRFRILTG